MRRVRKAGPGAFLAVVVFLFVFVACATAQERPLRVEIHERFDAALTLYREGEYKKAAAALDEIIKMSPSSKEALILREKAGIGMLVKMLKHPELGYGARMILRKAAEEAKHIRRDPATIRRMVEELGSDDVVVRWRAMRQLTATGPFAVPYLLDDALGEEALSPVSRKAAVIIAIRKMGPYGIPPLVTALRFADDAAGARIAGLISDNPDVRAVPALVSILEDPERPEFLKEAAERTLGRIFGAAEHPGDSQGKAEGEEARAYPSAAEAHLALALRYYHVDPALIEICPVGDRVLWKWNAKGKGYAEHLTHEDVPAYIYPRAMTEELLLAGMKHEHATPDLVGLYVCNNYVQLDEALALSSAPDASAETAAEAAERASRLEAVHVINESLGANYLYVALGKALRDHNTSLARRCVAALRNVGDPRLPKGGSSLVAALGYPDKLVRATAAETLMRLRPRGDLGAANEIVRVLAAGLGVRALERVVVLTEEDELYRRLAGELRQWKKLPQRRKDPAEALKRIKEMISPANLLVIDARREGVSASGLVNAVRQDVRVAKLPIIMLASADGLEGVQKTCGAMVSAVLPLDHEPATLKAAVESALSADISPGADDVRDNLELLRRILHVVTALPPGNKYPTAVLGTAAGSLIEGYPTDVRVLALKAVGNLAVADLKDAVYDIYADGREHLEVRRQAGATLLNLLVVSPDLEAGQRGLLRTMTADTDATLRVQARHALAIASISQAERVSNLRSMGSVGP